MSRYDIYTGRILSEIESGQAVSQRVLSRKLGIALGLTNLLVRRIVAKGWVKVAKLRANRIAYLITPSGHAEKTRIARSYLEQAIQLYTATRSRIRESFDRLSANWVPEDCDENGQKRVVFYGTGDVAEIGYVSLQDTDLRLVGVVDDEPRPSFFGLPVFRWDVLTPGRLNGEPFGRLVVMSLDEIEQIQARLQVIGIPPDRVWVPEISSGARGN